MVQIITDIRDKAPLLVSQTSEAVNATRGAMVLLLVFIHWSPGIFERLSIDYERFTNPLFRIATPGFAIIFGLSMGLYIFRRFDTDFNMAIRRLGKSFFVLSMGIGLLAFINYCNLLLTNQLPHRYLETELLFSVLLYYLIAIVSVPFWYLILKKFNNKIAAAVVCSGIMYGSAMIVKILLPTSAHLEGFNRLGGLMLEAKYNYFDMSFTVFLGIALGLYIKRQLELGRRDNKLTIYGILTVLIAILISFVTGDAHLWLTIELTPYWMDLTYFGLIMILLSCCLQFKVKANENNIFQFPFKLVSVFGTFSLRIYIGHGLVIPLKDMLVSLGLPYSPALTISMILFFVAIGIPTVRSYRKYYVN